MANTSDAEKSKSALPVVFLTVFIDLIGFGICLPLLSKYAQRYGASGWVIGAVLSSYSLMQLIFAPIWGAWSDRIGRRPILLLSSAGAAVSYLLFALSARYEGTLGLSVLLLSRVFAGICGGNIGVASAAIADVTLPENRSRGMSLIGIAFGLGFVVGPIIGGIASRKFGLAGPGIVAAAICAFNLLLAWKILPETLNPSNQATAKKATGNRWTLIQRIMSRPVVGFLIFIYFAGTFSFTCFESVLPLLLEDFYHLNEERTSYFFAYCGIVGALIQGAAVRPLVKLFGDHKLIWITLWLTALSLALLPYARKTGVMLAVLALFAGGSGLNRPPTMGLISRYSPNDDQGATLSVTQNAGTLARILGPLTATTLYHWRQSAPFFLCAAIAALAGLAAFQHLRGLAKSDKSPS